MPNDNPLLTAEVGGARLEITVADITTLDVDAIVNAANSSLAAIPAMRMRPLSVYSRSWRGDLWTATGPRLPGGGGVPRPALRGVVSLFDSRLIAMRMHAAAARLQRTDPCRRTVVSPVSD